MPPSPKLPRPVSRQQTDTPVDTFITTSPAPASQTQLVQDISPQQQCIETNIITNQSHNTQLTNEQRLTVESRTTVDQEFQMIEQQRLLQAQQEQQDMLRKQEEENRKRKASQ